MSRPSAAPSASSQQYGVEILAPNGEWVTSVYFHKRSDAEDSARRVRGARVALFTPERPTPAHAVGLLHKQA